MTIEEMKRRKKEYGYSNRALAEKSGVPLGTLQKIFSGVTSSPREETIRALEIALQPSPGYVLSEDGRSMYVSESVYAYGEKNFSPWTIIWLCRATCICAAHSFALRILSAASLVFFS